MSGKMFHFGQYSVVKPNFEFNLNGNILSEKLNQAQNDLNNQIIADTMDYVPFSQGILSNSVSFSQGILSNSVHVENGDEIVWNGPYARFLYIGKVMVDYRGSTWAEKGGTKHVTNRDLTYSKEAHKKAGSHWFERAIDDHLNDWIDIVKKAVK